MAFCARFAGLSKARRLPGGGSEVAVALAAAPAFAQDKPLAVTSEVSDQLALGRGRGDRRGAWVLPPREIRFPWREAHWRRVRKRALK